MDSIGCVIVTYNTGNSIIEVINSVEDKVNSIVVIDNGSDKETMDLLNEIKNKNNNVDIVLNYDNLGIATALNIGIKKLIEKGVDWILTLDHDSIVQDKMIENMLTLYKGLPKNIQNDIGIMGPEIFDVVINKSYYNVSDDVKYVELSHVIQSGALIKSDVFNKINFFDEKLFIYFVDLDFCYRARESGYKVIMVKNSHLLHEEGEKQKRKFLWLEFTYDNYSRYSIYYIIRNAVYMLKKYKEYQFLKRILYDFIKIMCAEPCKLKYVFLGIKDGLTNNYGKKFK